MEKYQSTPLLCSLKRATKWRSQISVLDCPNPPSQLHLWQPPETALPPPASRRRCCISHMFAVCYFKLLLSSKCQPHLWRTKLTHKSFTQPWILISLPCFSPLAGEESNCDKAPVLSHCLCASSHSVHQSCPHKKEVSSLIHF